MRVVLIRSFWVYRSGSTGLIDKHGRLRLKGSPTATAIPQDYGSLFRVL